MRYNEIISEDSTEPLPTIWYHSTERDPVVTANDMANNNIDPTGAVTWRDGEQYWFSDSWEASRYYGENTIVAHLDIRNPLIVSSEEFKASSPRGPVRWANKARDEGYDAVIIQDIMDGDMYSTVCAVFDVSQIHARPYAKWNEDTQDYDLL